MEVEMFGNRWRCMFWQRNVAQHVTRRVADGSDFYTDQFCKVH